MSEASSEHDRFDTLLRSMFEDVKDNIDSPFLIEIEEYLDNSEYGLAVEALAAGVIINEKKIDKKFIKCLINAALEMDIHDNRNINSLNLIVARRQTTEAAEVQHPSRDSYKKPR